MSAVKRARYREIAATYERAAMNQEEAARLWGPVDPHMAQQCLETAKGNYESAKRYDRLAEPWWRRIFV